MAVKRPKNTYWHFAQDDRLLGYDDGRKIVVGETLKVSPPIKPCKKGLHASKRAIDALGYARGAYVCLVTLGPDAQHDGDKSVSTERTVIAAIDATNLLFQFSMDVAARAMEAVGWEHEDSWNALTIRAAHMVGLADDSDLSAAWSAAWYAADSAAWYAAWSAARYAARYAARSAADSAAWSAEKQIQNDELERRLLGAM
ncbi:MAG TPA: hypothetical protein VHV32_19085 [Candidatus Angelobacter sp.]|nr:hypothetical protein [Candidatus Angelobacter sp.]